MNSGNYIAYIILCLQIKSPSAACGRKVESNRYTQISQLTLPFVSGFDVIRPKNRRYFKGSYYIDIDIGKQSALICTTITKYKFRLDLIHKSGSTHLFLLHRVFKVFQNKNR